MESRTRHRLPLLGLLTALCLGSVAPAAGAAPRATDPAASDPARELARTAHPLTDLRPLERIVGDAKVVGVGEATHSSSEFFRTKHRIFEHLVEKKGFTTFSLETSWGGGLLIDAYVQTGKGDPAKIMREALDSPVWNNQEYLDLIRWMRQHNVRHPEHRVHFMGNDVGYAPSSLFDRVERYVAEHHPALLPRFKELYRTSRPNAPTADWMQRYLEKPRPERQSMSADVNRALALLEGQKPEKPAKPGKRDKSAEERAWAVQNARAIAQVGTLYAFDLGEGHVHRAMEYRDRTMAENTVWWQRTTGDRMVLSAHNAHVGYETTDPVHYPKVQGAFMRDLLGKGYVTVGTTFGQGSFNANDTEQPGEPMRKFTVGPPAAGSNEHTLDRVSKRPYYLDLRTATGPARAWLAGTRPTRTIGTAYPWPNSEAPHRLGTLYDALIHFPRVTAAHLR
ncbi:erythromycin esterase family protein [Streptomyces sp. NPDC050504]|uniref:erythromycin esterase family protein n=1 Tax=Streptomyces sp. NPDC050504 TaxID=3365618 RepID=UPI0037B36D0D